MKKIFKILWLALIINHLPLIINAQIPVEVFAGHKKATADIMFFRVIKNKKGQHSRFLFFNRNRASIDYAMTTTSKLPQFGFTEAFSYNHEKFNGFAPVLVAGILNSGLYPKAGIQLAKTRHEFSIFTWIVAETRKAPNVDFFFLARYTPVLTDKLKLFSQIELVNAFPTTEKNNFSFTQRLRLGIAVKAFQFGAGLDLSQFGKTEFAITENVGGFLRYEF